ncbi:sorting nexin [Anaeramoeba ignava]|uniref:Sorting nexin n=1 Tax=Anaeramoeba ignava TaxID=1746090 RepID=A0A9Q0R8V5_ANAIG|nr:sorting nexin [Anaeramoeba ignava]
MDSVEFPVLAKFNFRASEPSELSFNEGDQIMVVFTDEDWMTGYLIKDPRKMGMFPVFYIEKVKYIQDSFDDDNDNDNNNQIINQDKEKHNSLTANISNELNAKKENEENISDNLKMENKLNQENINEQENKENTTNKLNDENQTKKENKQINQQETTQYEFPEEEYNIEENFQWKWKEDLPNFQIRITGTSKKGKFKKYMTYVILTTPGNYEVFHRYSHFRWLQTQLKRLFPFISIPTLPEKKVTGKFNEIFVENRRKELERFLHQIAEHPVLSQSFIFLDFIKNTDEQKWLLNQKMTDKVIRPFSSTIKPLFQKDSLEIMSEQHMKKHVDDFRIHIENFDQNIQDLQQGFNLENESLSEIGVSSIDFIKSLNDLVEIGFDWREESEWPQDSIDLKDSVISIKEAFNSQVDAIKNQIEKMKQFIFDLGDFTSIIPGFAEVLKHFDNSYSEFISKKNSFSKVENQKKNEKQKKRFEEAKKNLSIKGSIVMAELENYRQKRILEMKSKIKEYFCSQKDYCNKLVESFSKAEKTISNIQISKGIFEKK